MRDLRQRISELTQGEALEAAGYLANWIGKQAKEEGRFPAMESIPDEQEALEILGQVLPEMADRIIEIFAKDSKGEVARNFLSFLAEKESYAFKVEEALNRPSLREPFTVSVSAGILLLLFLEFDLEYVDKKGGKSLRISKKTPILEILKKILGL